MGRSVATLVGRYLGRSVATLVGRNAFWVGVFTEQRGEVGARGDSRSREVRLKDGGSRSREKGVEKTDFSTEADR